MEDEGALEKLVGLAFIISIVTWMIVGLVFMIASFEFLGPVLVVNTVVVFILLIPSVYYIKKSEKREKRYVNAFYNKQGYTPEEGLKSKLDRFIRNTQLTPGKLDKVDFGFSNHFRGIKVTQCRFTMKYRSDDGSNYFDHIAASAEVAPSGKKLWVRKEKREDKVKAFMGDNDIDFENKEFSDYFFVDAKPRRFGYDFFHPRMIELFNSNKGMRLIIKNGMVFLYFSVQDGKRGKVYLSGGDAVIRDMTDCREFLLEIIEKMPSFLSKNVPMEAEIIHEKIEVVCPKCELEFGFEGSVEEIECPRCGARGEI